MIVKILGKAHNGGFPGVTYNTDKIDRNKGELMKVNGFGALQGLSNLRPQDYINYLKSISAINKNVKYPQIHAVLSSKGDQYDKIQLTAIAEKWLKEMGYENQPYLVIFHKDTDNNHVHVVSTRVDREGQKINSAFERVRSQKAINDVLGYTYALQYQFSTRAQFFMLLEQAGYPGLDPSFGKVDKKIEAFKKNPERIAWLKAMLLDNKRHPDLAAHIFRDSGVELVFHAKDGKQPYGYTVIDHPSKTVYKGSEILKLSELIPHLSTGTAYAKKSEKAESENIENTYPSHIQSIWIADDVDDQQIHGMRRRRQRKARTNTR